MKKILSTVVIACALLLASCGSSNGSTDTNTDNDNTSAPVSASSEAVSSEAESDETSESGEEESDETSEAGDAVSYDEIFSSRNIVHMPEVFIGLDAVEFACVYEDSVVELEQLTYGCDEDTIVEWVSTIYVNVADMTDDEADSIKTQLKAAYDAYDALDCCEVTYSQAGKYFTIRVHFTELDNADNLADLATLGLIQGAADYLSLEQSESAMIAGGFVKKD